MKKILYCICVLFLFSLNLFGQEKQIDTLLKAIETAKTKELKVDAIIKLGNYWFERDYDSANYYYKKAHKISDEINYKKGFKIF